MEWIVFDEGERAEVMEYSEHTQYKIVPRLIDAQHAYNGLYVAPIQVIQGEYTDYWYSFLEGHERLNADPDALFIPSDV